MPTETFWPGIRSRGESSKSAGGEGADDEVEAEESWSWAEANGRNLGETEKPVSTSGDVVAKGLGLVHCIGDGSANVWR